MPSLAFPSARSTLCLAALLGMQWAAPALSEATTPTEEARAHLQAGLAAMRTKTREGFDKAYHEFKAAYDLTGSLKSLANFGAAAAALERDGEAIEALTRFISLGPGDVGVEDATAIRARLAELQAGSATVKLDAPGAFWIVDTRRDGSGDVVNEYGPFEGRAEFRVRAGDHQLELSRAELAAPEWRGELRPGNVVTHTFAPVLEPSPVEFADAAAAVPDGGTSTSLTHMIPYVFWGAGAAAGIAATVFALEANRLQNEADADFDRRCPFGTSAEPGCEKVTAGSAKAANWRTGALLTGMGALGLIVTGTVYYLVDSPPDPVASSQQVSLQPWVSVDSVGVTGTF
jgi:hypothetical protein